MPLTSGTKPHVLVLGGGYVGLYTAAGLRKSLGSRVAITLVDPRTYMTYQPFLPEVAGGAIDSRNVLASHRKILKGCRLVTGRVAEIKNADKTVSVAAEDGESFDISYDHLVVALGSVPRTLPIPGLAEQAIGFKNVEEAVALRNRVLENLSEAATTKDADVRKRLLTFTFVGGGFAGVEVLAEVEDMVRSALHLYPDLHRSDVKFVLIEAMGRILPELGEEQGKYGLIHLRERGIEVKLETFLNSCVDGIVKTSDGDEFATDAIVWTAGVKPNPVIGDSDLPVNQTGRLDCLPDLRVRGEDGPLEGVWAAGDCTTVPDLAAGEGKVCPPNAQHAVRQAKQLAANLANAINGEPLVDYFHKNAGIVASLGMWKGVAVIGSSFKIRGPLAWLMHRGYHLMVMPTIDRKARILSGWLINGVANRDYVPTSQTQNPRAEFIAAAESAAKAK